MASTIDPALTLRAACDALLNGKIDSARGLVSKDYPFSGRSPQPRRSTEFQKHQIFVRDGFIDRYTGKRLVFGGVLRLFSFLMPTEFPYHPNGKLDRCHMAYWELLPTLDHVTPVARGGLDQVDNLVTTSMATNAAKANWTLEELGWKILPRGDTAEWDALMTVFTTLVKADPSLMKDDEGETDPTILWTCETDFGRKA